MKPQKGTQSPDICELCNVTRKMVAESRYEECRAYISQGMSAYPHSSIPHNLMGVVLEKEGCHTSAMRHFRAAHALDPAYLPARHNLEHYGTFFSKGKCAYDESDCDERVNEAEQNKKTGHSGHCPNGGEDLYEFFGEA